MSDVVPRELQSQQEATWPDRRQHPLVRPGWTAVEAPCPLSSPLPARKSSTGCPPHPLWRQRPGRDQQRPACKLDEGGPAPASPLAP